MKVNSFLLNAFGFCSLIFGSTSAWSTEFGPTVKNANGTIKEMFEGEAAHYCEERGGHLPTAREWAYWAKAHGARGVREPSADTNLDWQKNRADGFGYVPGINSDVDFWYDSTGYKKPAAMEYEHFSFWTSSYFNKYINDNPPKTFHFVAFRGSNGEFESSAPNYWERAVRCAFNHSKGSPAIKTQE